MQFVTDDLNVGPLRPELRDEEERLIATGELPAVGRRFVAIRR